MSKPDPASVRRSRIQLILIFLLFLVPPVSAWVAWQYLGETGVEATTNAGTLVVPARPLQMAGLQLPDEGAALQDILRGHWTYLLFAADGCSEECQRQLYLTRQVRIAMNKDVSRVQRVLVLREPPAAALREQLASEHPDLQWLLAGSDAGWYRQFQGPGFSAQGAQYFLIDPLGNLMMFYDADVAAKGMMKDLRKLLKVSQIG